MDTEAESFAYAVDENDPHWNDAHRYVAEEAVEREFPWLVGLVKPLGLKIIVTDELVDAKIVIAKPQPGELCNFNLHRLGFDCRSGIATLRFRTNCDKPAAFILSPMDSGVVVRLWVDGSPVHAVASMAELRAMCDVFGVAIPGGDK